MFKLHPSRFKNWHYSSWLVHWIVLQVFKRIIPEYFRGIVYDIGCGDKPYRELILPYATKYIGVDHAGTVHSLAQVDIVGSAYDTTLESSSGDVVFSSAVLEHLEEPLRAFKEMHRICKKGGHLILAAPLCWQVHEKPRDFFRYTCYGLEYLMKESGFAVKELIPLSGIWVTLGAQFAFYLATQNKGIFKFIPVFPAMSVIVQIGALVIQTFDRGGRDWTWAYVVVGEKV
jgi:SAM-dependent methyltransferase